MFYLICAIIYILVVIRLLFAFDVLSFKGMKRNNKCTENLKEYRKGSLWGFHDILHKFIIKHDNHYIVSPANPVRISDCRRYNSLAEAATYILDTSNHEPINQLSSNKLRPALLEKFIGQENAKERIRLALEANEVFPHTILFGSAGLGKTTLANIIATETEGQLYTYTAPTIKTQQDLINILLQLKDGDVLFIDEIHRLKIELEELLYPVLEDYRIDITVGMADYQQMLQLPLPKITVIGATTISGLLSKPFLDRFEMHLNLQFYSHEDLFKVVKNSAKKLDLTLSKEIIKSICARSRGTPRIANNLLKNLSKFSKNGSISEQDAEKSYSLMDVDQYGFCSLDRRYLKALIDIFNCNPAGIASIASALCESKETLQQHVEPYLLHSGYITRTSKGRVIMPKALGVKL